MGGNALSVPGVRLDREDYLKVTSAITSQFPWLCLVESYKNKPSFGDADFLYTHSLDCVLDELKPVECYHNGPVTSVGIKTEKGLFQVDFIKCHESWLTFAVGYFGFNDFGNLVGRIAHKMGFKFGHDGLWYVLRDGTHVVAELLVTEDFRSALSFIGYDPKVYYSRAYYSKLDDDFRELEDIFKYVVNNPYFNKDIYLLENRNHTARVRDSKRKTYTTFLAWLEEQDTLSAFDWTDKSTLRLKFLEEAFKAFPSFDLAYHGAIGKYEIRKKAKTKFNGSIVSQLTHLEGKALGEFIAQFKKSWLNDDHFYHWCSVVDATDVEKAVMVFWDRFRVTP